MKEIKTLFFLAIPTTLSIVGQVNNIRAMFGISGGVAEGLFYLSLLLGLPIVYLLFKIIKEYMTKGSRHLSYEDFMSQHFFNAKDITVISSGAEQLSHFLEGLPLDKNRARPEVEVFIRNRDNGAVFEDRKTRLASSMARHGLKYSLNAMEWHPMMLSAVVADNSNGIFNVYLTARDGYMSRAHSHYLHATRGRCEFDDWLFGLFDRWNEDCRAAYSGVSNAS